MTDTTQAAGLTDEQIDKMLNELDDRALAHGDDLPGLALNSRGLPGYRAIVRAALAAQAVPAGWKLVPVEPTPEMVLAAWGSSSEEADSADPGTIAAWGRMLAASPAPAETPATDIDEAALARMTEQGAKAWAGVDAQSLRDGSYAPQPQAAQPVAWMFQHDEMGRCCFCANDGVNTIQSFVEANPRMLYVCALYPAAPALTEEQIARAVRPLYASDEAARMGLADDIATVRAALRSTQGGE